MLCSVRRGDPAPGSRPSEALLGATPPSASSAAATAAAAAAAAPVKLVEGLVDGPLAPSGPKGAEVKEEALGASTRVRCSVGCRASENWRSMPLSDGPEAACKGMGS